MKLRFKTYLLSATFCSFLLSDFCHAAKYEIETRTFLEGPSRTYVDIKFHKNLFPETSSSFIQEKRFGVDMPIADYKNEETTGGTEKPWKGKKERFL